MNEVMELLNHGRTKAINPEVRTLAGPFYCFTQITIDVRDLCYVFSLLNLCSG